MNKLYLVLLISLLSLLASCTVPVTKDPDSQFYSVQAGSKLILHKPVEIIANTARTFFQNGKIIAEKDLNIYYPHCSITTLNITDKTRTIQPTTFNIYKVADDEEEASLTIKYVARNLMSHTDGPTIIGQASYYYLKSNDEPDVARLECIQWGDPFYVKYVSINDIRQTLGNYFSLILKD